MPVRFIIGRAGTGKTHHCLTSIRRELQASPVAGPQLVMLVPEQASMQMERMLLAPPLTAIARAQVLSFTRLAHRILADVGGDRPEALSATARAMVLRTILFQLAPQLRYYRRPDRFSGFFERLGRSLGEFIEEGVSPGELRTFCDGLGDDPQRAAKFSDLIQIYEAYLAHLGDRQVDPSQHLHLACEALAGAKFLEGASIWVDGFAGFTGLQMKLLAALSSHAQAVEITALNDPDYFTRSDDPNDVCETDLFAKPQRTYFRLRDVLRCGGVAMDEPLLLTPAAPHRFGASDQLMDLERALSGNRAASSDARATRDVQIVRLTNTRTEVEFAVAQVCSLVQREGAAHRYRDIAIIVRDLEPYHDLLASALGDRGIPFFIDRRRTISHHAVVEFLRAAIAVAAEDFSLESVRQLIKSGLSGLDDEQGDELENYLLACGIVGRSLWEGEAWAFDPRGRSDRKTNAATDQILLRVNAERKTLLDGLSELTDLQGEQTGAAQSGAVWSDRIRALLAAKDVHEQIEQWAVAADENGAVALAAEHRQVWIAIDGFLGDLASSLGDQVLTLPELRAIVDAGLSQLTLGLVPPTVDQLLVGSIERSRHPELKAVILLGFNEGVFPRTAVEDAVLNDDDRDALNGAGLRVGVTRRQTVFDEQLLVYVALTRPAQKLLITYAGSDADGKSLRPSAYLDLLKAFLPELEVTAYGNAVRDRAMWSLTTVEDLAGALTQEMRHRPNIDADDGDVRARWNDLYLLARGSYGEDRRLALALSALAYENVAALSAESIERIPGSKWIASVSELETFAACPFKRFAGYGLRLRERPEASLQATDLGTVQHAVLEDFINRSMHQGDTFANIDENEVMHRLEAIAGNLASDWTELAGHTTARDAYLLERSSRDLSPIVKAQQRVSSAGRFRPKAAELKFGFSADPTSLPPLELNTPRGRVVRIRGLIDRVDLAELADETVGIVVDYKRTRNKRFDVGEAYHGLSLQLLGYLLLLADQGETLAGRPIRPVGAFYVSLLQGYESVDHPADAADLAPDRGAAPRGILDTDRIDVLESDAPPTGRSKIFSFFRKKDGTLGNIDRGDGAEQEQFADLLEHTRHKLGELADRILDGDVAVAPYRLKDFSPCQWCEVNSVCRFEFGDRGMRHLVPLKRSEVFTQLGGDE